MDQPRKGPHSCTAATTTEVIIALKSQSTQLCKNQIMCDNFYVLEMFGRRWVITGGLEAAATLREPITPNSWELSLTVLFLPGMRGWQWR